MTFRTRRTIFYSLVLLFALIAPIIVLMSFGYSVNLRKWHVEKTGGIFIKSKTPRMSLFLDGTFVKETSFLSGNALITDITPGPHLLRLEKADFYSISKTVEVAPVTVTEFRNILLIPNPVIAATSTPEEVRAIGEWLLSPMAGKMPAGVSASAENPSPKKLGTVTRDRKKNLLMGTGTSTRVLASDVHSFAEIGEKIIFVSANGFLAAMDIKSGDMQTLGRPGFFISEKPFRFIASPSDETAILDSAGGLFLLDAENQLTLVRGDVERASFDRTGAKLLFATSHSIETLWRVNADYQPFQKKGTRESVFRSDEPILDAQWFFDDNNHILIRKKREVLFTELDARGGRNAVILVPEKTDEIATVPDLGARVFFKIGNAWFTITL
ncbi:MAG: hypothetical protein G01um101433_703 [Parcubacteria group bacterium Gr01-1014_33]|nr:MAG: hypothetical protein G01um101433_703 [Parcubacteria group bacterium Gr01-1014_33]